MNLTKYFLYSIFIFLVLFHSCERLDLKKDILIETSGEVTFSLTEAWISGQIVDAGEGIVEYGHCWSVKPNPKARNFRTTFSDVNDSEFQSTLSGLSERVWYYVRAYAIDKDLDTIYSEGEIDFIIENVWVKLADFPGTPRMGAFGFAIDNICYFGGGTSHEGSNMINLDDFWKYDPQNSDNNGWATLSEYPGLPVYNKTFVINNIGYVFNGKEKTLFGFEPANNLWFPMAGLPDDNERMAPFIFVYDNKAYLLGGSNSNISFYYDPGINEWIEWDQGFQSGGRQNAYGFNIGDRIFVGGGFNSEENIFEPAVYSEFYEYNFYSSIWIEKENIVVNSYYPRYCAINNKGYVLDYQKLLQYDPDFGEFGTWSQVASLEVPKLFPTFIRSGNIAYLFCGARQQDTDLSTWLRTPNTATDNQNWTMLNDFYAYVPPVN